MRMMFFLPLICSAFYTHAQSGFEIRGDVHSVKDTIQKVYLSYYVNGIAKMDSADVLSGTYHLKGSLADPSLVSLRPSYKQQPGKPIRALSFRRDIIQIFLDNATVAVSSVDSFAHATVTGSNSHDEYKKLQSLTKVENDQMAALNIKYAAFRKNKDEAGMKQIDEEAETLSAAISKKNKEYVLANPNSPIALFALGTFAGYDIKPEEVEPVFNMLSENLRMSASGQEMAARIEKAKKTAVGSLAMDFTQNDTLGKPVSLSSFRGKYVLVDFWASWCGPCRQENPNVVAAYAKYHVKGFDVLGVSLDQPNAKEKWMKAIHDDNLTWTHVSDLKYWKNDVAVMYGIQAIPQNFLISPEGIIVGKNLRGDNLNRKLEEIIR